MCIQTYKRIFELLNTNTLANDLTESYMTTFGKSGTFYVLHHLFHG